MKYKEKLNQQFRRRGNDTRVQDVPEYQSHVDTLQPEIVRKKQIASKPMEVDEAALQIELLDHDFFVFTNAETNQINVLYRRGDGNPGLIETH